MEGNHIVDVGINMKDISDEAIAALRTVADDPIVEEDYSPEESNIVIPIVQERKF